MTYWRVFIFGVAMILVGAGLFGLYRREQMFPDGSTLIPDEQGIIHHPYYGDYPQVIPFHQGMNMMPGQRAYMNIPVVEPAPDDTQGA